MMTFEATILDACFIIHPKKLDDERGWFERVYCEEEFSSIGFKEKFVQINHSFNLTKGTLRGIHYQSPPHGETKLIRCVAGKILDVVVDLRKNSPTLLQWISVELSETNQNMILIPKGCAHGFITLEDRSQLIYHHTAFYKSDAECGIHFQDSLLNIDWQMEPTVISERDLNFSFLDKNFSGIEP